MEESNSTAVVVSSGAVGALCALASTWIKAKIGNRQKVEADPSPFPVQHQGPFVTVGECKQHRCAIDKRIDSYAELLKKLPPMIEGIDERAERRAVQLHRRLDPLIEKIAATSAEVEMLKGLAKP